MSWKDVEKLVLDYFFGDKGIFETKFKTISKYFKDAHNIKLDYKKIKYDDLLYSKDGLEFEDRLQDEEFKNKFEALKRGYVEDFIRNPGFVLHLEPEKRSRETLRQYKELSSSNMLHNSNRFSRDSGN